MTLLTSTADTQKDKFLGLALEDPVLEMGQHRALRNSTFLTQEVDSELVQLYTQVNT